MEHAFVVFGVGHERRVQNVVDVIDQGDGGGGDMHKSGIVVLVEGLQEQSDEHVEHDNHVEDSS